MFYNIVG